MYSVPLLLVVVLACVGSSLGRYGSERRLGKRHDRIVGGWHEADPNSEDLQEAAEYFVQEFAQKNGVNTHIRMGEIRDAQAQVVGGMNYKFEIDLEHTDCPQGTNDATEANCPTTETQTCTAQVYIRAWENFRKLTSYNCQ